MKGAFAMNPLFFNYLQDFLVWKQTNGISGFYNNGLSDQYEDFLEFVCTDPRAGEFSVYVSSLSAALELNFPITLNF